MTSTPRAVRTPPNPRFHDAEIAPGLPKTAVLYISKHAGRTLVSGLWLSVAQRRISPLLPARRPRLHSALIRRREPCIRWATTRGVSWRADETRVQQRRARGMRPAPPVPFRAPELLSRQAVHVARAAASQHKETTR